ncbi:MAG: purine-nucleoside phosphorylase [Syntrophotaleaceae bacterium]
MDEGLRESCRVIAGQCGEDPFDLAVVLGSGLGKAIQGIEDPVVVPYTELDCLPRQLVAGHAGQLVTGHLHGRRLLCFLGRFHCYQGCSARQASIQIRLAHALGCPRVLLTNAAGGIDPGLAPGDFLFVTDHINLLGDNPLRGETVDPFIDLTGLYPQHYFERLKIYATERGIGLRQGVLAAVAGPSYETPAEVRALALLGAAAVSMSTIPEAIMAGYLGIEPVALSFIANRAAGLGGRKLTHQDVLQAGEKGARDLALLFEEMVRLWL